MADKSVRYTPEFKRQMVELARTGRSPPSLAKEFGPTPWSIATWVKQAVRYSGHLENRVGIRALLARYRDA